MDRLAKPRLRRLERLFANEPVIFLTLCTFHHKTILANRGVHSVFTLFGEKATNHGVFVGRYVLMPDHVHLFAAFSSPGVSMSSWVKSLKNALSKTLRTQNVTGPHWQKGFFDHVLPSNESYAAKWEYVRLNPVLAGLVMRAEDWPYQGEIHVLSCESRPYKHS